MSSSFPTSWEPYGSSQQNATLAWRRDAALPSQQAPLTTRWQATTDATQASPLPSLDPSQRVATELSAFQANDREQKSVARFESLREEMQHITGQLRQLNANIENLRNSQAQPFSTLIGEVGRLSQLVSEILQRPGIHGPQSNFQFSMTAEKHTADTVLAMSEAVAALQTSCAAFIPRLDSGLGGLERLIQNTTANVAGDMPAWFEMAFRQMVVHQIAPMLMESEKRVAHQIETKVGNIVEDIEKHVSMAVGNGVAQVLNKITLEQSLGASPSSANVFAANNLGDTKPQNKPASIPNKDAVVKQTPGDTSVARSAKNGSRSSGPVPKATEPPPSQRVKSAKEMQQSDGRHVQIHASSALETPLNPETQLQKTQAVSNSGVQTYAIVDTEPKPKPSPSTQNGANPLDSKDNPEKGTVRKEDDSPVEEIDIFEENEIQKKATVPKTKEKEGTQRKNGKKEVRQARQKRQQYTIQSPCSDSESSESKDASEEGGEEEESEWECNESDPDSQSSGGFHGPEGQNRAGTKRLKRSFVRRSKRRRRA